MGLRDREGRGGSGRDIKHDWRQRKKKGPKIRLEELGDRGARVYTQEPRIQHVNMQSSIQCNEAEEGAALVGMKTDSSQASHASQ